MALAEDTDAKSPKEPPAAADEAAMASASDGEGEGDGMKRRGRASRMAVERGAGDASICVAAGVGERIVGPFWEGGGEGPVRSLFDGGPGEEGLDRGMATEPRSFESSILPCTMFPGISLKSILSMIES